MHVTKASKNTTQSKTTETDYMTTITNKHISLSSTPPLGLLTGASVHEDKLPDYVVPVMAAVTAVAVTICVVIFLALMKKKKILDKLKQCCVVILYNKFIIMRCYFIRC